MIAAPRLALRLALFVACLALSATGAAAQPVPEYRGFWVDTFNTRLNTADDVAAVITRARSARANLLLVQVRRRGDSWYLNSVEPVPDGVTFERSFDPLQEVIAQAHAAGLQVHAGVVVADIWHQTVLPSSPSHVFNQHGLMPSGGTFPGRANWLTRTLLPDGQTSSYGGHRFGTDFWIDPGHPDAVAYTVGVITRLVSSYDVDGLHLDRLQYPELGAANGAEAGGASVGYNDTSLERYRRRRHLPSDFMPPADEPSWNEWRREQVTALLRRVYLSVAATKPGLVVSVAAHASGDAPASDGAWPAAEPASRVFQDWRAWMEEGIVDLAVPMTYLPEHTSSGAGRFQTWLAWTRGHLYGRHAAMGIGAYLNSIEGTLRQVREALGAAVAESQSAFATAPPGGAILFSMGAHNAPVNQNPLALSQRDTPYRSFEDLAAGLTTGRTASGQLLEASSLTPLFEANVPVPIVPWKALPATGHVKGVVTGPGGAPIDGAAISIEAAGGAVRISAARTDGGGFFGRVGLTPGEYHVVVVPDGDGQYRSSCTVKVVAGAVATIDLRIDAGSPVTAACQ